MNRITDEGQGAEAKADHQLEGREAAVEDHTPAKGRCRTAAVLVLAGMGLPLDRYRWMAGSVAMPVVIGMALVGSRAGIIGLGHGA